MKKTLAIAFLLSIGLGACQIHTCPTYSKKNVEPVQKTLEASEIENA